MEALHQRRWEAVLPALLGMLRQRMKEGDVPPEHPDEAAER